MDLKRDQQACDEERQVTFSEVVSMCAGNKELVREFDRLTGSNLSLKGNGLDLLIDYSTGRIAAGLEQFVAFVHEFIWLPLAGGEDKP